MALAMSPYCVTNASWRNELYFYKKNGLEDCEILEVKNYWENMKNCPPIMQLKKNRVVNIVFPIIPISYF
jgi:hypothetical protein